ncbi:hypothetical protein RHSIM_Rhsim11G0027900 [Rhododendron simsii]|uniref:Uncharacterized protein n=1 Tax=Rhododendron simsii TaxID=118357 RepID=A0A834G642_RHOSS|nr:hypothetical protein RHSIM_Rhsim11G0027900 [Rhododendron simsii]
MVGFSYTLPPSPSRILNQSIPLSIDPLTLAPAVVAQPLSQPQSPPFSTAAAATPSTKIPHSSDCGLRSSCSSQSNPPTKTPLLRLCISSRGRAAVSLSRSLLLGEWAHNLEFSLSFQRQTQLFVSVSVSPIAVLVVAVFSPRTTTEIGAQSSLFKAEVALLLLNRFKVLTIESIRILHRSILTRKHSFVVVKIHLIRRGFDSCYKTWVHHGESVPAPQAYDDDHHDSNEGNGDETGGEVFVGGLLDDDSDELPANLGRGDVRSFDKLFNAAQRKIFPGCEKTVLAFLVEILHVKVYKKMPNDTFNIMMNIIKGMRPDYDEAIPWNTYEAKKNLKGFGYKVNDAPDLRWHKDKRVDDDELRHPADAQEWKNFDEQFPDFAAELRNCMKEPFCFMSLLIPGPSSIGKDIDVYLRPLVDELKELWKNGVQTYYASTGKTFTMRACVFWTIHDFPAYGMMFGWSTKGYLACSICNCDFSSVK